MLYNIRVFFSPCIIQCEMGGLISTEWNENSVVEQWENVIVNSMILVWYPSIKIIIEG